MSDFVWPSDYARAASRELDRVCDYLEDTLDDLDALRATNSDLRALYESTRVELGEARARVAELAEKANSLSYGIVMSLTDEQQEPFAKQFAELQNCIAAQSSDPYVLRKQAEALEAMAEKIRNDTRGTNTLWEMLIVMDVEAQELREKAEAAERAGGEQ